MWIPSLLVNFIYRPLTFFKSAAGAAGGGAGAASGSTTTTSSHTLGRRSASMSGSSRFSIDSTSCRFGIGSRGATEGLLPTTTAYAPLACNDADAGTNPAPATSKFKPDLHLPSLSELAKDLLLMGPAREMHCSAAVCRLMDWREARCACVCACVCVCVCVCEY